MNQVLIFILILLACSSTVFAQRYETIGLDEQQSVHFVERMDSLLEQFQYQKRYPTKADTLSMNRYGYSAYEIPKFSPEEYQKRLKEMCALVKMDYNSYVKLFIDVYATRKRNLTSQMLGLQHIYFPIIEEVFEREGVPLELKYVAAIESAFNPYAVSNREAVGLWQFVYATGKMYGLRIDNYVDERRDPYKSTVAAAKYFKDLYRIFNDWHLVLASYNAGPGTVSRAIRRSGGITNYWKLSAYLPRATAAYVPAFIGCAYAMTYSTEHNLYPIWADFSFQQDTITIVNQHVTLEEIAAATDTDLMLLKKLNPELKLAAIPLSSKPYSVRVPSKTAIIAHQINYRFNSQSEATPTTPQVSIEDKPVKPVATYTPPAAAPKPANKKLMFHAVTNGETLSRIAVYYSVSDKELMAWNQLKSPSLYAGQTLKVYVDPNLKPNVQRPATTQAQQAATAQSKNYVVRNGDTLWLIAQRNKGVDLEKLMAINGLTKNSILKVGQVIKLPN